jgi:hypothetical protein
MARRPFLISFSFSSCRGSDKWCRLLSISRSVNCYHVPSYKKAPHRPPAPANKWCAQANEPYI